MTGDTFTCVTRVVAASNGWLGGQGKRDRQEDPVQRGFPLSPATNPGYATGQTVSSHACVGDRFRQRVMRPSGEAFMLCVDRTIRSVGVVVRW